MSIRRTQAVLVIHGIGEQRPMDTLRGFVESLLPPRDDGEPYFSKPDRIAQELELRKLQDRSQPRTHFFEYYWSYKVEGSRISHVAGWVKALLWRRPGTVPRHLRGLWWLSWVLLIAAVVFWIAVLVPHRRHLIGEHAPFWLALVTSALLLAIQGIVLHYVADAARYLSPLPANIGLRQRIRSEGIRTLRMLHEAREPNGTRTYDRVIVVGHSLGSVIGYDIITHLWQEMHATYATPFRAPQAMLDAAERSIEALEAQGSAGLDTYRKAQRHLWWELQELGHPWLVTDFITMGSPLGHAAILLAHDPDNLARRQRQRELPTCPPQTEVDGGRRRVSYREWTAYADQNGTEHQLRALHHAAPFAVTRWTNLYVPVRRVLFGDVIASSLARWFGDGIGDHGVAVDGWRGWRTVTPMAHTAYWNRTGAATASPSLDGLVAALNREGDDTFPERVRWTKQQSSSAASLLWAHRQNGTSAPALPIPIRPYTKKAGYAVQRGQAELSGMASAGWKVAGTNPGERHRLRIGEPIAGQLFPDRVLSNATSVPYCGNRMRVVEAEFAFRLGKDIPARATKYSLEHVLDAVDALCPALEIPNSRLEDLVRLGEPQLIADNACADYLVLGAATSAWRTVDLAAHVVQVAVGTGKRAQQVGAHVFGDPRDALLWLVNELSEQEIDLLSGQVVATGACVTLALENEDHIVADFGPLGTVAAHFSG